MTKYVHHTAGVIDVEFGMLPRSWENTSGLRMASAESLREKGWLPVIESRPEYDPATHYLSGPTGVSVGDNVALDAESVTATWTAVETPVSVPEQVTPLQARRALRAAGLFDAVAGWVAQQDADTQDAWEYATVIERDNALLAGAAAALGMTEEQIDQLFILAATFI